jgi:hypothetical protein
MRTSRLATVCVAVLAATLVSGAALAKDAKRPAPPKNLRGFLLKPNEPFTQVFPRTPAFSWAPVRGARCYEFELATSRRFASNSVVWSNVQETVDGRACQPVPADPGASTGSASDPTQPSTTTGTATAGTAEEPQLLQPLRVPAVSVDVVLPWFTGSPHALYARVRAVTGSGPTGWSKPFGFNMQWQTKPAPLKTSPGMVRWTPVEGATGYQVWYPQLGKSFSTNTNVADLRDFYTFHRQTSSWWNTVRWRVRAVRRVSGTVVNGLPAVSYGQWSPIFTAANPALNSGPLRLVAATSDRVSVKRKSKAHEVMPSLVFAGDQGLDGQAYELFRTYVATDRDCVNIVFKGSVVGSPSFAPRTSGPLQLPEDAEKIESVKSRAFPRALPDYENEGDNLTWTSDWRKVVSSETIQATTAVSAGTAPSDAPVDESATVVQARVDLPDVDFPSTRYYWTVVPVAFMVNPSNDDEAKTLKKGYVDVESPQDACQAGRVMSFGKRSDPVTTGNAGGSPFVSGLNPSGRFLTSSQRRPVVYSTPLVAWMPATGATAYQVQWSKTRYPWRSSGTVKTYATSAVLSLAPGTWYYRIRGLNQTQLRRAEMAWSAPVALKVAQPRFSIAGG